jgi:hypothetical protein
MTVRNNQTQCGLCSHVNQRKYTHSANVFRKGNKTLPKSKLADFKFVYGDSEWINTPTIHCCYKQFNKLIGRDNKILTALVTQKIQQTVMTSSDNNDQLQQRGRIDPVIVEENTVAEEYVPIVLMIEDGTWGWKLSSHYELAIDNFLETRRVNNVTQNVDNIHHGMESLKTSHGVTPTIDKRKVTCRQDYNAIHCRIANHCVKYLFILAHGDDNAIVFQNFSIPLNEFLKKISNVYKNLIWLHIGTCSTLANYSPADKCGYSFTISGYQIDIDFDSGMMYDQYILAAGFNAGTSAIDVYRALKPFANGKSSTPLSLDDLKFVVYPPINTNST